MRHYSRAKTCSPLHILFLLIFSVHAKMYPNNADPKQAAYASQPAGQWTTGLCDCSQDFSNCCVTCCCPCVTFGRNAEIVDRGQTSCACGGLTFYALFHLGCACLYTCTYRTKLRAFYSLPEDPCNDCCVHFWCNLCALCQEHRELKNRGLDPTIGWIANAQKMNGGTTTPPFVAPGMTR